MAMTPFSLYRNSSVATGGGAGSRSPETIRNELYKNRSSRKIDSHRLFSREYDFPKTFSLTENQFSGKTYFYTIASRRQLADDYETRMGQLQRDLQVQGSFKGGRVSSLTVKRQYDEDMRHIKGNLKGTTTN